MPKVRSENGRYRSETCAMRNDLRSAAEKLAIKNLVHIPPPAFPPLSVLATHAAGLSLSLSLSPGPLDAQDKPQPKVFT